MSHTKVSSIEHEEIFDSVRSLSIPPHLKETYMPYILHSRINGLVAIAANTPDIICVKRHPYMKRLMHDIEQLSLLPHGMDLVTYYLYSFGEVYC